MNNNPNLAMTGAGAMMGNMGGLFSGGIGGIDPMMMGKGSRGVVSQSPVRRYQIASGMGGMGGMGMMVKFPYTRLPTRTWHTIHFRIR